jgi:outer membrane protein assembly factor BamB
MTIRSLAVCLLFATSAVRAEDWPGWLGPRRDGSSAEKVAPWKGDLKIAWKKPVGEAHSSPIVAEGKVFLHTKVKDKNIERVEAWDVKTGDSVWTKEYEHAPFKAFYGNGPRGTPSAAGGKLYTLGITGILSCFDAKDGATLWQVDTLKEFKATNLFFGVSCSPLVDESRVYVNVGGKGASLVAFEKDTGKTAWQSLDDKASYSAPIMITQQGKKQLVCLTGANLVAVNPQDGKKIWEYPFRDILFESSTTPVRVGDLLFGSSITLGSVGLKLKGDTVEKAWAEPKLTCYFSTPVAVGNDLYVVVGTNPLTGIKGAKASLRCVDAATGKERWKKDNVGKYHASLTRTADNKLLLVEEGGALVLVDPDPKEYRELARATICGTTWAHPAVSNGRFFIRDNNQLVCVELPQ